MKYIIVLFLFMAACAKPGDANNNSAASTVKVWLSTSPDWQLSIDLSSRDVQAIRWTMAFGEICDSAAIVSASTITIALSTEISPPQGSDAPCSMFDGAWNYSLSGGVLTIQQTSPSAGSPVTLY